MATSSVHYDISMSERIKTLKKLSNFFNGTIFEVSVARVSKKRRQKWIFKTLNIIVKII